MITYNNLINRFETFANSNHFIRTFTHGSPDGVDLDKFELYPAMHVVYTGATYGDLDKTYSFEVYILSLPPNKTDAADFSASVISESEQVAEDLIADLRTGGDVFKRNDLYSIESAFTTPLEDAQSNVLSGILLNISIIAGFDNSSCNAPLT